MEPLTTQKKQKQKTMVTDKQVQRKRERVDRGEGGRVICHLCKEALKANVELTPGDGVWAWQLSRGNMDLHDLLFFPPPHPLKFKTKIQQTNKKNRLFGL
uniref:Uncharacterized protein n=1 Tax=Anguilla anguilla TaxID=7936 RepID=A0A0E9WYV6_ANGAN